MLENIDIDHKILAKHFGNTIQAMHYLKKRYREGYENQWKLYVKAYNYDNLAVKKTYTHYRRAEVIKMYMNAEKSCQDEAAIDIINLLFDSLEK